MMPEMAEMMEPNIFEDSMYVLSNEQNIDGASALFYPGVQEEIYKHMGKEYYVLPSSIHETIIVPKNASMNSTELKNMVMEINGKEVSPDEVLTDSVYEYDARSKTLTIANDERYRVNTKDIVKAGFKPTKTLVKSMESLNKSVGRNCSLKDVKELAQDAKASTITKDIAKDIVKECQAGKDNGTAYEVKHMEKEKENIFIDTETICEEELRLGDAYEQNKQRNERVPGADSE